MCLRYLWDKCQRLSRDAGRELGIHIPINPLRLLDYVQTGVDDELVHILRVIREAEPRNAIAAAFGCTESDVEQRGIAW